MPLLWSVLLTGVSFPTGSLEMPDCLRPLQGQMRGSHEEDENVRELMGVLARPFLFLLGGPLDLISEKLRASGAQLLPILSCKSPASD